MKGEDRAQHWAQKPENEVARQSPNKGFPGDLTWTLYQVPSNNPFALYAKKVDT